MRENRDATASPMSPLLSEKAPKQPVLRCPYCVNMSASVSTKILISVAGKPLAQFVCPGHPLLDAVVDLVLNQHRQTLREGAVLVDPTDPGQEPRLLFLPGTNHP
ncbi:MAG: hypothetical protein M5U34_27290 [Chloroflexi bacterium]|nr:hypothetical protein [Chloroflexota bacterium]